MYEDGQGVEKNYEIAVKWHRKAAENGDYGSQLQMCKFYENGLGVIEDLVEAEKWYQMAKANSPEMLRLYEGLGWFQSKQHPVAQQAIPDHA